MHLYLALLLGFPPPRLWSIGAQARAPGLVTGPAAPAAPKQICWPGVLGLMPREIAVRVYRRVIFVII